MYARPNCSIWTRKIRPASPFSQLGSRPAKKIPTLQTTSEEDPLKILAAKLISEANAEDEAQFVFSTQLDVEEPKTYNRATSGTHAPQWSQAMREVLDQLEKNNTWTLVRKDQIPAGHRLLGGKWVYKVKRDVNGNIACFKARWVVKRGSNGCVQSMASSGA